MRIKPVLISGLLAALAAVGHAQPLGAPPGAPSLPAPSALPAPPAQAAPAAPAATDPAKAARKGKAAKPAARSTKPHAKAKTHKAGKPAHSADATARAAALKSGAKKDRAAKADKTAKADKAARPQAPRESGAAPAGPATLAAFVEQLVLRRPTLAALLEDPSTLVWNESERTLLVRPASDFAAASLNRNREILGAAAVATFGAGVSVRFAAAESRPATEAPAPAAVREQVSAERKAEVSEHPRVQAVLEIFGGGVANIESATAPPAGTEDPTPFEDAP